MFTQFIIGGFDFFVIILGFTFVPFLPVNSRFLRIFCWVSRFLLCHGEYFADSQWIGMYLYGHSHFLLCHGKYFADSESVITENLLSHTFMTQDSLFWTKQLWKSPNCIAQELFLVVWRKWTKTQENSLTKNHNKISAKILEWIHLVEKILQKYWKFWLMFVRVQFYDLRRVTVVRHVPYFWQISLATSVKNLWFQNNPLLYQREIFPTVRSQGTMLSPMAKIYLCNCLKVPLQRPLFLHRIPA